MTWSIESTSLGRIVVPDVTPDDVIVFCTTSDFEGRLTESGVHAVHTLLRERFDFEGRLSSCAQVHGASVASVGASNGWNEVAGCDAMVSTSPGVALAIKVADCLPLALLDAESSGVANVHSGWRGAAARVVPATLSKLSAENGTDAAMLRAWIGPHIRVCCFEVGEEVVAQLESAYGPIDELVDRSQERPHINLAGLTTRTLIESGLPPDAIDDSGLCTRCEGSIFHSYRRDGERAGRNLMVIGGRGT